MTNTLLVLGGSGFVGPAIVLEGLARGYAVTTFHRGAAGWTHPDVRAIRGDRLDPASLTPLRQRDWDLVIDIWSGAPRAVRDSAGALRDHAGHYVYISSESVYLPPPSRGADESAPTVDADPGADATSYPEDKRGGEIAVEEAFGARAVMARAGTILGPYEDAGRLTWWLGRMAGGGEILCPGPIDLPLQCIDARDLAAFAIDAATAGSSGPFNVVSRRGHATMGSLLEACRTVAGATDARLTWVAPDAIAAAGIEPWTELPIWLPEDHEYAAMHDANVERAHEAGLHCRPVEDTVADTWRWLSA
ncbi:MAG: NAD-dependent epimerase/dehydratase family protein, partial [Solirubrobacteraceae bacterium]